MKKTLLAIVASLCAASVSAQTFTPDYSGLNPIDSAIIAACVKLVNPDVRWDDSYREIDYPMGDVPADCGNDADAVVRVFREIGFDLQEQVYKDVEANKRLVFCNVDPKQDCPYNITHPFDGVAADKNVNHRKTSNLYECFYSHCLESVCHGGFFVGGRSDIAGSVVFWKKEDGKLHIGILVDPQRGLCFHQNGKGQVIEPVMNKWEIVAIFHQDGVNFPGYCKASLSSAFEEWLQRALEAYNQRNAE